MMMKQHYNLVLSGKGHHPHSFHAEISGIALEQFLLIQYHDPDAQDKKMRLTINGKGCDGFKYAVGLDFLEKNDTVLKLVHPRVDFTCLLDPFVSFYLRRFFIDYEIDPISDEDGFTVINYDQKLFEGKFWKDKPHLEPSSPS